MELIPDIDRLTQTFSNAVAPAFFVGAVAAFVSLMMSRLAAVNERINATRALPDQDRAAVGSSMAFGPLMRRARLLSDGIILSLGGGVPVFCENQAISRVLADADARSSGITFSANSPIECSNSASVMSPNTNWHIR